MYLLIGGGGTIFILLAVVVMMMNKSPTPRKTKRLNKALKVIDDAADSWADDSLSSEETDSGVVMFDKTDQQQDVNWVSSWEELPPGEYLPKDEHGTVWFKTNDGQHWFQNDDDSWKLYNK